MVALCQGGVLFFSFYRDQSSNTHLHIRLRPRPEALSVSSVLVVAFPYLVTRSYNLTDSPYSQYSSQHRIDQISKRIGTGRGGSFRKAHSV